MIPFYKETQINRYLIKGNLLKAAVNRHWEISKAQRRQYLLLNASSSPAIAALRPKLSTGRLQWTTSFRGLGLRSSS